MSEILVEKTSKKNTNQKLFLSEWGYKTADFYTREKPFVSSLYRLGFITSGMGFMNVGGRSYELKEGDTYLIEAGNVYYYNSDSKNPMNKLWAHFSGEIASEILRFYGVEKINHFKGFDSYDYISQIHSSALSSKDFYNNTEINAIFIGLIEEIAKWRFKELEIEDIAEKIEAYLNAHTCESIRLDNISVALGISKEHAIRLFKKRYGITPHQYILDRKIELAKFYLKLTDLSVEDISVILNFNTSSHFSSTFFKAVGVRPLKFKKEQQ